MLKACPLLGGVQGCIAPPKFPNLQKKVPQIAVCEQRKSEKLGILCIFGQRNGSKIQGRVLFCQICTLWGKNKTPEFLQNAHIQKIRKRSTFEKFAPSSQTKILGMSLVEASQMHRLRKQGGLRELSPLNILSGGLEYPLTPQKILYP